MKIYIFLRATYIYI